MGVIWMLFWIHKKVGEEKKENFLGGSCLLLQRFFFHGWADSDRLLDLRGHVHGPLASGFGQIRNNNHKNDYYLFPLHFLKKSIWKIFFFGEVLGS